MVLLFKDSSYFYWLQGLVWVMSLCESSEAFDTKQQLYHKHLSRFRKMREKVLIATRECGNNAL